MTSAPSASDRPEHRLHRGVLAWIHEQGWRSLRPVQIAALDPVLAGDTDVIVSAPTAGGKTEAAFLPICSALAAQRDDGTALPGVKALYVSPLKALINDQFGRLELLCRRIDVPVHRWHGDVAASAKVRVRRHPDGIVIITPESLEALFVTGGPDVQRILGGLRYLVVDELHAFLGTVRGAQLQSLLHRVEVAVGRRVPRVALSATLADEVAARDFLRPGEGSGVRYLDLGSSFDVRLRVHGYIDRAPDAGDDLDEADETSAVAAISARLFALRGTDNLVFANSRSGVERYSDRLATLSDRARVPREFLPHHGNLSKEVREHAESRLKDPTAPATVICTSTLEMGIDIGSVDTVQQIGAPPGVAPLRQRLGRSGRRTGVPTLRLHVPEPAPDTRMTLDAELRTELVQAVAMVELMGDRWLEPPNTSDLHLSTLIQQVLSVVAQEGGASASSLHGRLCGRGPFHRVTAPMFASLLRAMGAAELLTQGSDGLLLAGRRGDRLINHYSFYAAFQTAEEFRVLVGSKTLGTLPIERPVRVGQLMIFAGQRWRVLEVDTDKRTIALTPSSGGKVPPFPPGGPLVADAVRRRMRALYLDDRRPAWLDETAMSLLDEGRAAFARLRLAESAMLARGTSTVLLPWRGDTVLNTLVIVLQARGLDVAQGRVEIAVQDVSPEVLHEHLSELASAPPADAVELAAGVAVKQADKYDRFLSPELLAHAYAARSLDIPNTWHALRELAGGTTPRPATPRAAPASTGRPVELGVTPFAVLDVETTGFDAAGRDRIVEIAIVRLSPTGDPIDSWSTLIDPGRPPGPTRIHGLTAADLRGAPTFADIAGEVAARLDGAVVVAHNADFDLRFLGAEFERAGLAAPAWPTLCTLALAYRVGSASSRRLGDLCEAEGLVHGDRHSALGDAEATAALLAVFLARARAGGAGRAEELGVSRLELPPPAVPMTASVTTHHRTRVVAVPQSATPAPATGDERVDAYLDVLERADPDADTDDTDLLRTVALDLGLGAADVARVHRRLAAAGSPR